MKVKVLIVKSFNFVSEDENAKYLNKGDIYLPDSTGWDYKVSHKVLSNEGLNVMVIPLSKGARQYAEVKQANIKP